MFRRQFNLLVVALAATFLAGFPPRASATLDIATSPLFAQIAFPPLNMLVMGKDHKLWYEAYNDTSDLNGDGIIDVGYKPNEVTYFGLFDSFRCYEWNGTIFRPILVTATKKCSGSWSGDFLNYLTTSRIDALRKVLYGGDRSTDSATQTILERAHIPRDGHTWGKEYESIARDGYDITEYAPLSLPLAGRRHLFANVSLSNTGAPLLRVLVNSPFRIWNWVSIERPVADNDCFNSTNTRVNCLSAGTAVGFPGVPADRAQMDTIEATYALTAFRFGGPRGFYAAPINCTSNACNPDGTDDRYLSVFRGIIDIDLAGEYEFAVDGDDAIDFVLSRQVDPDTGAFVDEILAAQRYGANTLAGAPASVSDDEDLDAGEYPFEIRHVDDTGGDGYVLYWRKVDGGNEFPWQVVPVVGTTNPNGGIRIINFNQYYNLAPTGVITTRTDYTVRVEVCRNATLAEDNCKAYPSGALKPTGLLHEYGEEDRMFFGLITGTWSNNTEGGVLRRAMGSFTGEINPTDGTFSALNGIVGNLRRLRIVGFDYGGSSYNVNCPALGNRGINNGECSMWGNPIAEMAYESMRYFAGASAATPLYATGGAATGTTQETTLGLTRATWNNPYASFPTCSKPFQTIISDVNPSYDTGLPGNPWGATTPNGTTPATISGFDAAAQGDAIWNHEFGGSRNVFIGQVGATTDSAPSVKTASSFGNIRGLAPEEPTKGGGYYTASVARYGYVNDINAASGQQNLQTFSVALASPLPRIEFPIASDPNRRITLVPLGKSVGGCFGTNPVGTFQPTNTIVDFYVEKLVNAPGQPSEPATNGGRPYAVFRINYEDVEQGNDHDMDAIVRYELLANADDTVTVNLASEYAAGCVIQHLGYVISGTTADGIYLEVRDRDTGATASPAHWFNTPPGATAGQCRTNVTTAPCNQGLPLTATRVFTAGATSGAELLRDPLWYAAKYGGFKDRDPDGPTGPLTPDGLPQGTEWDERGAPVTNGPDGVPDSYFLVTNALGLRDQLRRAFDEILDRARPTGGVAISGVRIDAGSLSYLPEFNPDDWTGDLKARRVLPDGTLGPETWSANAVLPAAASRNLVVATSPGFATGSPTLAASAFTVAGLGGSTGARALLDLSAAQLATQYGYADPDVGIDRAVAFLRGDPSREINNGGTFRNRQTRIGDIVGSQPEVDGNADDFGYRRLTGSAGTSYASYLTGTRASRPSVVYVAANDGKLHGFRTSDGVELFAFVPSTTLPQLKELLAPAYVHRYLADGSPTTGDALIGSAWRTYLVASTGAGGRSVYALDVTNPAGFTASDVEWEITSAMDGDLGVRIGTPVIAATEGNRWVAVFGNGYNSDGFDARVFVVDLATGNVLRKFNVGDGDAANPNGVGNVLVIDSDSDGYSDTIYAGTYRGEVWKMNIGDPSEANWGVATNTSGVAAPLFVAERGGVRQPITGGFDAVRGPTLQDGSGNNVSTTMLLFGTGRYFVVGDNIPITNPPIQSFYGVLDDQATLAIGRSNLVEQQITAQNNVVSNPGPPAVVQNVQRNLTNNVIDFGIERGWYVDLLVQSGPSPVGDGERFVGQPAAVGGSVFFITFTPSGDQCQPGGRNFFYGLDALTGAPVLQGARFGSTDPCGGSLGCGGIDSGQSGPPAQRPAFVVPPTGCVPGIDPGCANLTDCDPADLSCQELLCDPRDPDCVPPCDPTTDPNCRPACPSGDPTCVAPPAAPTQCLLREIVQGINVNRPCGRQIWRQMQ